MANALWRLEGPPLQDRWTLDYKGRTFEWGNWTILHLDREARTLRASGGLCTLQVALSYDATAMSYLEQLDARRATRSFTLRGTLNQPPTFVRGQAGELRAVGTIGPLPPPELAEGLTIARACNLAPYGTKVGTWKNLGAFEDEPWACVGVDVDMTTAREADLSTENSMSFQVTGTDRAPRSLRLGLFARAPTGDVLRQFAMKAGELTRQATGKDVPPALERHLLEARPGSVGLDGFSGTIMRDDHQNTTGFSLRYALAVGGAGTARTDAQLAEKPDARQTERDVTRAKASAKKSRPSKVTERLELPCRPGQLPPCYD